MTHWVRPKAPLSAIKAAAELDEAPSSNAAIDDPHAWVVESFNVAKASIYKDPIGNGAGPFTLDEERVALAGAPVWRTSSTTRFDRRWRLSIETAIPVAPCSAVLHAPSPRTASILLDRRRGRGRLVGTHARLFPVRREPSRTNRSATDLDRTILSSIRQCREQHHIPY